MPAAHERLEHVYTRIKSAHNTLQSIVDRAEGRDSGSSGSIDGDIQARINHINKMIDEEILPDGWGSYPETHTVKKTTTDGRKYTVEQYSYDDASPIQTATLKELNVLLGRAAQLDMKREKKEKEEEIPQFIYDHCEKLGQLLSEMDEMRKNKNHPYSQKRTRES